ncbi:proline iminopeptidase-family hydrolase [Ponticoccus alexandrii]|uniref:Proline iminopeptidase-family hydrolase n=1 Tax=Ponticoccus alexandrii TaxID=1943633 RepID=A0ABX7FHG6_9RHOB|nr:proline iminopeptidase-family hydrolase [Ponticoccus alexandrii]ETA49462.1 amino acid amidase [Rhodobacteraceae bacterium PD-2]QRF69361.1 proline iminopeptidase-family hydrolase [Ponticoccus alexandrii]
MTPAPLRSTEGFAPFGEHQTWYRITGDLDGARPPLVIVHGGPGCTHDYLDNLTALAGDGRAVIHYDQIGNGKSTHLPGQGADFWTVALFLRELDNLLAHLGIADRYDLLGQSWGGMLGAEHAIRRPRGLNRLVIANSPTSIARWSSEAERLRSALPATIQATLRHHEADGAYTHPDYKAASDVYYQRHVCRCEPWPDFVRRTFDWVDRDPTVYHTMWGPTEFLGTGSLKNWTVEDRLAQINVPTLVVTGAFDEATPHAAEMFSTLIPDVHWRIFGQSSHMPHVEEEAAYMSAVDAFLRASGATSTDAQNGASHG